MRRLVLATLLALGRAAAEEPAFPIMAWDHPPDDPAALRKMRDCGLTVAGFVRPAGLDRCRAAGLKAIVYDERTAGYDWAKVDPAAARPRVAELVRAVRDHPAVLGYYLRDEPSADLFPGLAAVAGAVRELHPGAWPYVNLFPNYATPDQLGTPTYEAYLDKFVEACKPPVISYDHYALYEGGGFGDAYFTNLESVRRVALKHGLPFWTIVQACGCLNFREPSAADLRFQAYTSLAYGTRGLAYFTYFGAPVGNFRMAAVDQFGHETATWRSLQNVNLQVAKLGPTLLKLRSDGAYHFGKVPPGCGGPGEASLIAAAGGPLMAGDFTHADGTRYVLVVNKDFAKSHPCQLQFRAPPAKVEFVSPYSGLPTPFEGEQVWLAPGQGVLLKLGK